MVREIIFKLNSIRLSWENMKPVLIIIMCTNKATSLQARQGAHDIFLLIQLVALQSFALASNI